MTTHASHRHPTLCPPAAPVGVSVTHPRLGLLGTLGRALVAAAVPVDGGWIPSPPSPPAAPVPEPHR